MTVCVAAYTLRYLRGGGAYMWVFLNWALGLGALGCRVLWLDSFVHGVDVDLLRAEVAELKSRLRRHGLSDRLVVTCRNADAAHPRLEGVLELEQAWAEADVLIDLGYDLDGAAVDGFRRSIFVDIDPGLTQLWISRDELRIARHDRYFTYGENVGTPGSRVPDCGITWHYTPPPVFLGAWRTEPADAGAPYCTVSDWWGGHWIEIDGILVDNSKRASFLEFLDLPAKAGVRLELALPLVGEEDVTGDLGQLRTHGWRLRHVRDVAESCATYLDYVRASRGQFACMKRGYRELETGWMGEQALNYLASGKPVIVQYTGRTRFLPDAEGLFRFRDSDEAARSLKQAEQDYDRHRKAARALAEEYFDAVAVTASVLSRALT